MATRVLIGLLALCFAIVTSGCGGGSRLADDPVPPITVTFKYGPPDDEFVAIARVVSGFAGLWSDDEGRLVLMLVDPSQANRARIAVSQLFQFTPAAFAEARIQPAKFDSIQLVGWKDEFFMRCLSAGVVSLDADEHRNLVVVGATSEASHDVILGCAEGIGIPPDALDIVPDSPVIPL